MRIRRQVAQIYSDRTNQSISTISRDMDRDWFMTAAEAKEYGLIDEVAVALALFAVCSSNIAFDITPDTDVVAIGMIASSPSEETIVLAPVVPVILKSVDTFVFFAVFAVIADA